MWHHGAFREFFTVFGFTKSTFVWLAPSSLWSPINIESRRSSDLKLFGPLYITMLHISIFRKLSYGWNDKWYSYHYLCLWLRTWLCFCPSMAFTICVARIIKILKTFLSHCWSTAEQGHLLVVENFGAFQLNHGLMEAGYVDHKPTNQTMASSTIGNTDQGESLSISMTATMDTMGNLFLGNSSVYEFSFH